MLHNNLKLSNNFLNVCYAQSVTTKYNNCFIQVYLYNIGLTAQKNQKGGQQPSLHSSHLRKSENQHKVPASCDPLSSIVWRKYLL